MDGEGAALVSGCHQAERAAKLCFKSRLKTQRDNEQRDRGSLYAGDGLTTGGEKLLLLPMASICVSFSANVFFGDFLFPGSKYFCIDHTKMLLVETKILIYMEINVDSLDLH